MTYQDYFRKANFNEAWKTLHDVYNEDDETRPLYQTVYQSVCEMDEDKTHSAQTIEMMRTASGDVSITGAPDPQEWLAGREVDAFDIENVNEAVGHLLYWSTLYGIKTQRLQEESFSKWLDYQMRGPFYTLPDGDLDEIGKGVMVKYIFLDFDGVLNTEQYQAQLALEGKPAKDEYGPLFDPKAVARLSEIVESTKAKIFVISSWSEVLGKDKILEMWEKRGLPGKIRVVFVPDEKCLSMSQWIKACLNRETFLPYVILDDESQFLPEQEEYLIKVSPVTGISKENIEQAISILNRFDNLPPRVFDDMDYENERQRISRINAESCDRKKLKYWEDAIIGDEAYDWSWNFTILRKKLEYNIGYYRFTQRYGGWEKDVERMALACRLMNIATGGDSIYETDIYVNTRNCSKFGMKSSEFEDDEEFIDVHKNDLRKEKAYRLVWTVLQQKMKRWWN